MKERRKIKNPHTIMEQLTIVIILVPFPSNPFSVYIRKTKCF